MALALLLLTGVGSSNQCISIESEILKLKTIPSNHTNTYKVLASLRANLPENLQWTASR